jgi:hypothetical protein
VRAVEPDTLDTITVTAPIPSPWRTIWFSPRRTMRNILGTDDRPNWIPVVVIAAAATAVGSLQSGPAGSIDVNASLMPVIVGVLQMISGVIVGPFLLAFVCGWFGGDADPSDIRQSVAWSYLPLGLTGLLQIPLLLLVGGGAEEPSTGAALASLPLLIGVFAGVVWSVVLQIVTLAEVQRFSILKSIAVFLLFLVPLLLLRLLA